MTKHTAPQQAPFYWPAQPTVSSGNVLKNNIFLVKVRGVALTFIQHSPHSNQLLRPSAG